MSEISEIFDKDPLSLTKEDRRKIIEKYREDRARFMLGLKAPKATSKPSLNLDDLDI
jgi:hypothetical protein